LPATSLGYVLLALVAKFALHEDVSPMRWLGIALISGGVGFVAGGPALTADEHLEPALLAAKDTTKNGASAEEVVSGGVQR
jgi:hypothetical protein